MSRHRSGNHTPARAAGLRVAALTGAVLAAGAITVGIVDEVDDPVDTVVSTNTWPLGSTCCPEENS